MRTVSLSEVAGGVRWLTLNRPDHLNALTAQLVADFGAALDQVDRDSSCRVMILTGAGRASAPALTSMVTATANWSPPRGQPAGS